MLIYKSDFGMMASIFIALMFAVGLMSCAVGGHGQTDAKPVVVRQWQVMELSFISRQVHANPLSEIQLTAEFLGPAGVRFHMCGFYDGHETWKVRFSPSASGEWSYRTTCNQQDDVGLFDVAGRFLVQAPAMDEANALFRHGGFLRVSQDHHYLTYTDGTSFFWLGDTWWCVPSELVPLDRSNRPEIPSMYSKLLETRKQERFTMLHMAFVTKPGQPNPSPYMEIANDHFDQTYWNNVDRYIGEANSAGLMPVIGLGFAFKGHDQPSLAQLERVWSYILARYGANAITFLICGEYNVATGPNRTYTKEDLAWIDKILALGRFIKDHDPYQRAMTVHPWYYSYDGGQARQQSWCDIVMVQGGHETNFHGGPQQEWYRQIYDHPQPKPLIEGERMYEGIHGAKADLVRRCAYLAMQSGCCGYTYGAQGLWYPTQDENDKTFSEWGSPIPWWQAIEQPGGQQMKHLRECYEMLDWWKLRPVDTDQVLDLGKQSTSDEKPLVKADIPSGQFLIYLPTAGAHIDRIQIKGLTPGSGYKRITFNPRTGQHKDEQLQADATGRIPLPILEQHEDAAVLFRREN